MKIKSGILYKMITILLSMFVGLIVLPLFATWKILTTQPQPVLQRRHSSPGMLEKN